MRSYLNSSYQNVSRWDGVDRFNIARSADIPEIEKLLINIHESNLQNKRDKYILSFFVEMITGQRVSPRMVKKLSYKNILVVKKAQPMSGRSQVTLRGSDIYAFLDKWISFSMPRSFQFSGLRVLKMDVNGGTSLYFDDVFSFLEVDSINSLAHKCNGIQINISMKDGSIYPSISSNLNINGPKNVSGVVETSIDTFLSWGPTYKKEAVYILSGFQLPLKSEGEIFNREYPNLNFFNGS